MKITRLSVSNLLRIKAAEVNPDGSLVIVAGRNDQGKTSLLNSIAIALSGKDVPTQPIRAGATSGHVILETEELVITRKFSASGGGSLEVRDAAGARISSPQAKLDTLVSKVTFDPFEFTRMKPDAQVSTLKSILGLDFTDLDEEYQAKYEQRTGVNRSVKEKDTLLKSKPRQPDAPEKEVSVAQLSAKLQEAKKKNAENEKQREAASDACDAVDAARKDVKEAGADRDRLSAELMTAEEKVRQSINAVKAAVEQRDKLQQETAKLEDEDEAAILNEIAASEETNRKVRANQEWTATHREYVKLQQDANELTTRLEAIDAEKSQKLQAAKYPVEGLGFSDSGVTYNGLPFDQAGTAVKIRVSVAVGRSLSPKLPVMLVRDGSLLDKDSLALLADEAEKHGSQIWLEMVGDRDDATVVIEEGEVSARPAEAKKSSKKQPR